MEEETAPNVETFNTPVAAPAADGGGGGCDVRGSEGASCCSGCCCGFMAEADDVDRDFCVVGFVPADVVGCGARNIAARLFLLLLACVHCYQSNEARIRESSARHKDSASMVSRTPRLCADLRTGNEGGRKGERRGGVGC